jgi:hypothetical protein
MTLIPNHKCKFPKKLNPRWGFHSKLSQIYAAFQKKGGGGGVEIASGGFEWERELQKGRNITKKHGIFLGFFIFLGTKEYNWTIFLCKEDTWHQ